VPGFLRTESTCATLNMLGNCPCSNDRDARCAIIGEMSEQDLSNGSWVALLRCISQICRCLVITQFCMCQCFECGCIHVHLHLLAYWKSTLVIASCWAQNWNNSMPLELPTEYCKPGCAITSNHSIEITKYKNSGLVEDGAYHVESTH